MNKNPKVFINHVKECVEHIEKFTKKISKKDFKNSVLIQDTVVRKLEIIGEATKNIPQKLKNNFTNIRWRYIAGLRNILIHEYFDIDLEIIWKIIKKRYSYT